MLKCDDKDDSLQMCGLCGNGCSAWDWETTGYALLNSTELEVLPPTRICTESHPRSSLLRSPHPLSAPCLCTAVRLLRGPGALTLTLCAILVPGVASLTPNLCEPLRRALGAVLSSRGGSTHPKPLYGGGRAHPRRRCVGVCGPTPSLELYTAHTARAD